MRYRSPRNVARVSLLSGLLALSGSLTAQAAFACNATAEHDGPSRADESGLSVSTGVIDFGKDYETAEVGILSIGSPPTGAWAWVPTSAPS